MIVKLLTEHHLGFLSFKGGCRGLSESTLVKMSFCLLSDVPSEHRCVKWVIDLTLAYPDGDPLDMPGMCIGWYKPRHNRVHYRAYPVSEIPPDIDGRTKWLYDRYVEKEHLLDEFYKKNQNLDDSDAQTRQLPRMKRREVPFSLLHYSLAYIFYAISAYVFWLWVYSPILMVIKYLVTLPLSLF